MPDDEMVLKTPVRMIIVDDHAVVRHGLALVLQLAPDFQVVGEASDGREGLELVQRLRPDLVLMDLVMPVMDGKQAAIAMRRALPGVRILILSGAELDDRLIDVLAIGVDGYVLKDIEPKELLRAMRCVMNGEAYLHPLVARRVLDRLHPAQPTEKAQAPSVSSPQPRQTKIGLFAGEKSDEGEALPTFTPREMEILQHMTTPASYKEIADALAISEETVRTHAKRVLSKLGQPNRVQAVLAAVRLGLVDLPD
jgi:NarL family two-component system response regulator LiaR